VNRAGHSQTLVAAHPGNANRLVHGLYSKREIAPEVRELADELMSLQHVAETDYAAALEIAKLVLLVDRIDAALADGRLERGTALRALVDQRRRFSMQLERWYSVFGLTPESRLAYARSVGGGLADELRRIRERREEVS
jgi:hypothetical protein